MQLYKNIFSQSWTITRKHPALWLLGVFLLFWGSKSIELEQFFTTANLLNSPTSFIRPSFWQANQLLVVVNTFSNNWVVLSGLIALFAVTLVLVFVLIMVAHIGTIDAYTQFDHSKNERYTLRHSVAALYKYFVPASSVQLLTKGIGYALVIVTALPLFYTELGGMRFVYTLALYFITTPIAVVFSAIGKFATAAVIVDGMPVRRALSKGWALFRKHYGIVIEYMVFSYIVYTFVTTIAVAASLLVTMPMLYIGFAQWASQDTGAGIYLYKWVSQAIGVVITFTVASVFSAWHMGGWALLYSSLHNEKHESVTKRLWQGKK